MNYFCQNKLISFSSHPFSLFKDNVMSHLSSREMKIIAIISGIFCLLATCYFSLTETWPSLRTKIKIAKDLKTERFDNEQAEDGLKAKTVRTAKTSVKTASLANATVINNTNKKAFNDAVAASKAKVAAENAAASAKAKAAAEEAELADVLALVEALDAAEAAALGKKLDKVEAIEYAKAQKAKKAAEDAAAKAAADAKAKQDAQKTQLQELPADVKQLIESQIVQGDLIKKKLQTDFKPNGYLMTRQQIPFDDMLPAIVYAEKTRLYFNSQNIPVGYTARGFEDYVITSILKNRAQTKRSSNKKFKPFVNQANDAMLNQKDTSESMKKIFCLSSNLYDTLHGESYFYFMLEGAASFLPKSQSDYKEYIQSLVNDKKEVAENIFSLYCEYNQKLKDLQASRLLYTIAFTDLNQNKNIFRFSKAWGFNLSIASWFSNINETLLHYNKQTKVSVQEQDSPQLRACKPGTDKDYGMRVVRCYKSEDQKKIHREFKKKLKAILKDNNILKTF